MTDDEKVEAIREESFERAAADRFAELERQERAAIQAEAELDMLAAALKLAEAGYYVLPGIPGEKRPYVKGGEAFGNASRDPEQVRSWWEKFPGAEILIATGPSGLVVFDIDGPVGEKSFREFYGPNTPAPPTPIASTPRKEGGRQVLFLALEDVPIKGTVGIRPGLDIRAWGNVIVAPPAPGREWWHGCDPFTVRPAPLAGHVVPMLAVEEPQTAATAPTDDFERVLSHVERAHRHAGYALGLCPAHNDHNPSLSVKQRHDGISVKCFAHCSFREIASALEARGMPRGLIGRKADASAATAIPEGRRYKTTSMGKFLAREIPPRETVCGFVSASTLTLVVAWRGTGKTHFGLGIAIAVASGGRFLHWNAPKPRRVLYIDGELPEEDLQERVKLAAATVTEQQADPSENLRILSAAENKGAPNLAEADGRAAVDEHLEGVDVLVLDSLTTLCRGGEENKAESWQPIQDWLVTLRARGIAVVLLHHTGKDQKTQRGSSKHEDVFDWSLLLKQPTDYDPTAGARFETTFEKTRHRRDPAAIAPFEAHLGTDEHGRPSWTVKPLAEARDAKIMNLHTLGLSVREIIEEMKVPRSTVYRVIEKQKRSAA